MGIEAEVPNVAPQPTRPSWVVIVASVIAVLAVPFLLIWTALTPVPLLPYSLLTQEELMEGLIEPRPLPRICTIIARTERQRQRQEQQCPPEALRSEAERAEDDAGPASLRPRPDE